MASRQRPKFKWSREKVSVIILHCRIVVYSRTGEELMYLADLLSLDQAPINLFLWTTSFRPRYHESLGLTGRTRCYLFSEMQGFCLYYT